LRIIKGDFTDTRVVELVKTHFTTARAETAEGSAHALDLTGLQVPEISFWSIWDEDELLGVGALKRLSPQHGEVKSMHIVTTRRGQGAGRAMLDHIVEAAKSEGMSRLSLETGSWEYFRAARAFYRRNGFADCAPFANYRTDPNSVFMSLDLKRD
jgi:putative acetyltransferase